jgi:hypothetical protein
VDGVLAKIGRWVWQAPATGSHMEHPAMSAGAGSRRRACLRLGATPSIEIMQSQFTRRVVPDVTVKA